MAFLDTSISEGFYTFLSKLSPCALVLVGLCNDQIVQVATSPIMPAQSRTDNNAVFFCHKAHTGIASQIGFNLFSFISAAQADILGYLPKSDHFVIMVIGSIDTVINIHP